MKRWTRWAGTLALLLVLSGCAAGYGLTARSSHRAASSRPHPSYYCYDCHGDRFFDPYYDWCAYYGFRYAWAGRPDVVTLYRQRYLAIKREHPEYGRYRYRADYRDTRRYREPADYEAWRHGGGARPGAAERAPERPKIKEKKHNDAGKRMKNREREEPRDSKPHDSRREGV
jgi:hypothetical protein